MALQEEFIPTRKFVPQTENEVFGAIDCFLMADEGNRSMTKTEQRIEQIDLLLMLVGI